MSGETGRAKKRIRGILAVCIIAAALIGVAAAGLYLYSRSAWMRSASPDGDYRISIYAQEGFGLLNVPTYLQIEVRGKDSLFQRETIFARIDNDDNDVEPNRNVFVFWTGDDSAQIVLLGWEQYPEVISIDFTGNRVEYERARASSAEAKKILNEFGVDVNALTSWLFC